MKVEQTAQVAYALDWLVKNTSEIKFTAKNRGIGTMQVMVVIPTNGAVVEASIPMLKQGEFNSTEFIKTVEWLRKTAGNEPVAKESERADKQDKAGVERERVFTNPGTVEYGESGPR